MLIIDTSVWIDYFNNQVNPYTNTADQVLKTQVITVGDLIYCEILRGFRKDIDYRKCKAALDSLHKVSISGFSVALKAAQNFRFLKSKGVTVRSTIDMLIATYCIENDAKLLHKDNDFTQIARFLNLKVVPVN